MSIQKIVPPEQQEARMIELMSLVGLRPEYLERYPHEFSGGQRQRIGIARALAVNPKIIICDESDSALDVSIKAQILNLLKQLQKDLDLTFLFISHDLGVVRHMCDHISIMYKGRFVETGSREDIYHDPRHIYTNRLLSAIPNIEPETRIERKKVRQRVEAAYREDQHKYYDENGKVYPLKEVSSRHSVAMMAATEKGGV